VKSVLELLDLIGVTNNLDFALITRLEYALPLDDLPDALFLLGEGRVLSWDLRLVLDSEFLCVVLEHLDVAVVKLVFICLDERPRRLGKHGHHERYVVALNLDVQRDPHSAQDLGPESDSYDLGALWFDDAAFIVSRVDCDPL
jgi:hypothetical protein